MAPTSDTEGTWTLAVFNPNLMRYFPSPFITLLIWAFNSQDVFGVGYTLTDSFILLYKKLQEVILDIKETRNDPDY